jgi:hypothetical protein
MIQLSTGILRRLLNEDTAHPQPNVILQVLDLKKIVPNPRPDAPNTTGSTTDRYR